MKHRVVCDKCGAINPVKSFRLDPRNLQERCSLLCAPCRKKLGYTAVDFGHGYFPSVGRRSA